MVKKYLWLLLVAAFVVLYFSISFTTSAKSCPCPTQRCCPPRITVTPTATPTATPVPYLTVIPTPRRVSPTPTRRPVPTGYWQLVRKTNPATNITSTSAYMSGSIDAIRVGDPIMTIPDISVGFSYWEASVPANVTRVVTISFTYYYPITSGRTITGLKPNTTYEYAISTANSPSAYGNIEAFTTLP